MHTFDDILKFKPHCYALRSDGSFCETGLFDCGLLHKIFNYVVFFARSALPTSCADITLDTQPPLFYRLLILMQLPVNFLP